MNIAIITTINRYEDTFIRHMKENCCNIIVVGDVKTPHYSYSNVGVDYINPDISNEFEDFSRLLPCNHYCRKNIGYLKAISSKARSILDTDDDNLLVKNFSDWFSQSLINKVISPKFPNILKKFSDMHIWPRGYPLEYVNIDQKIIVNDCSQEDIESVGIIQSLVNGDADVDAICRLTNKDYSDRIEFKDNQTFIFDRGVFSQGNTQSTLWIRPELFHLLYIPTTVSFRFCDVLKMYIAQRCMWEYGYKFAVTSPVFEQKRNYHDYMKDFKSEISMYKCLKELLDEHLTNVSLDGSYYDLLNVYKILLNKKIVKDEEMKILESWLCNIVTS